MKKSKTLLVVLFLSFFSNVIYAQEHMNFKGIPIDGNVNVFVYFFSAILILSFSTPLIIQMMNYKNFELSRKYKKIQLNSLQSISNIGGISIIYFFPFISL